jgi:hypothetical protein
VVSVGVAVFLLGLTVLGLIARARSREAPVWWAPPSGPAAAGRAERTEQGLVNEAHRVRADEAAWEVTLSEEGVNAWLALRLPEWMASQSPPVSAPVESAQALFRPGLLFAGGRTGERIFSLGAAPRVDEAGRLVLSVRSTSLGRLSLPVGWVLNALAGRAPAAGTGWRLEHGDLIIDRPELRLADGRRVRVVGVECGDGVLTVRCRTAGASGR